MATEWIEDRISRIYSRVKSKTMSELKKTYPDLNFTQEDNVNNISKFPSVYMYFSWIERGRTLDIGGINLVSMSVRTRVAVTESQGNSVAEKVNQVVRDKLNELGFGTDSSPIPTSLNGTKFINASYSRMIGVHDPIIF